MITQEAIAKLPISELLDMAEFLNKIGDQINSSKFSEWQHDYNMIKAEIKGRMN